MMNDPFDAFYRRLNLFVSKIQNTHLIETIYYVDVSLQICKCQMLYFSYGRN
jgi:hypothetical protein